MVNATLEKRAERLPRPSAACLCHIYCWTPLSVMVNKCQGSLFVNAGCSDVRSRLFSLSWVHCNILLGSLKLGSGINCALSYNFVFANKVSLLQYPIPATPNHKSPHKDQCTGGIPNLCVCAHGWSYFAGGPGTTEAPLLSALCALRFLHCELLSALL